MKYHEENDELITIFSGNPVDAEMINQLLNDNNIETLIKNQLMGTLAPWQVTAGGHAPVEVVVHERDAGKAKNLIEEFYKQD